MKRLLSLTFIILCLIMVGCSNRRTSFGVGVGVVYNINPDPETKRRNALSTWYTSSSTLSSTYDQKEFISSITIDFIHQQYEQIAEESAKGEGEHLVVLAKLVGKPPSQYSKFKLALQKKYKTFFARSPQSPLTPLQFLKILQSPHFTNLSSPL